MGSVPFKVSYKRPKELTIAGVRPGALQQETRGTFERNFMLLQLMRDRGCRRAFRCALSAQPAILRRHLLCRLFAGRQCISGNRIILIFKNTVELLSRLRIRISPPESEQDKHTFEFDGHFNERPRKIGEGVAWQLFGVMR